MKITLNNNYISASFKARNKDIRKADDIQRASRRAFPILSPSYADEFYKTIQSNKENQTNEKAVKQFKRLDRKLTALRTTAANMRMPFYSITHPPYESSLNAVKIMKTGNCEECAEAALAALYANGYYNSDKMYLEYETEFINKKTKKSEYKETDNLDHAIVITTLGNKNPKEKDRIVVDNWLGFSDSISGAKGRYKQIFGDKYLDDITSKHRSLFRLNKYIETGSFIDFNDYELRQNFKFTPVSELKSSERLTQEDKENLGFYSRIFFQETVLPDKK